MSIRTMVLTMALLVSGAARAADASDFTLRDINGQEVSLSAYKGDVVVLSFWATWCGPCKVEMPHLHDLYVADKDKGLVVLSISADDARTSSQVKPYIAKMGYTFQVLLDKEGAVGKLYNPDGTLPYTVIIDKTGAISKTHAGYNPGDETELKTEIEGLLSPTP